MTTQSVRDRAEIPQQYLWDQESVYESPEAWAAALERLHGLLPGLAAFEGRLSEGPGTLADFFEAREEATRLAGRLYTYASFSRSVDTRDRAATARLEQAGSLLSRFQGTLGFAEPELLAISDERLQEWVETSPALAPYAHYFDVLARRRAHVRSGAVESLLKQVSDPFRTATSSHGLLVDADLTFEPAVDAAGEEIPLAQGNLGKLLTDPDRTVRRTAWERYADAHLSFRHSIANIVATGAKQHAFLARARRYESSLEAALAPNHIPTEVFYNLLETFRANLPTWHRYWRLRRRALGVERLHPYDIKAPLSQASPTVSYEQAVSWIARGLTPLGDEYASVAREGMLEGQWVDVYPNQGKRSGAFSSGTPGTKPFIMMSYNDDLFSLSTLAHEIGHSMHSFLSWRRQPQIYARYTIFLAEVASNFNQVLVRDSLLSESASPEMQIAVIEEAMSNFHRYFFIMPTLARFELELHERVERGEGLTADGMIDLMASLFAEGYGDEVEVDRERVGITWAQFPIHMYGNFYVFQYATGISAAHALGRRVLDGEPGAVDAYLHFLGRGGSAYPLDVLRDAGVDMSSPTPVEETYRVLDGYVDRLEALLENRTD